MILRRWLYRERDKRVATAEQSRIKFLRQESKRLKRIGEEEKVFIE